MRAAAVVAASLLAVVGCGNPATPTPSATPPSSTEPPSQSALAPSPSATQTPVDGRFSGKVDIGDGKSFYLACVGSGSPTVILLHGLGASAADWSLVLDRIDDVTHTCAVDRIGAGASSRVTEDRTTSAIVDDLHSLLEVAEIETPVVIVGHSIAGLELRLLAGRYPADVAGMVFIDPLAVGQPAALLAALPPPSPTESEAIRNLRVELRGGWPGPEATTERYDIAASEASVAAVTSFGDIPVIVLSAGLGDGSISEPTRTAFQAAWYALHDELAAMSTSGRREVVDGARHVIQLDRPEAVVDAIAELVQVARAEPR